MKVQNSACVRSGFVVQICSFSLLSRYFYRLINQMLVVWDPVFRCGVHARTPFRSLKLKNLKDLDS